MARKLAVMAFVVVVMMAVTMTQVSVAQEVCKMSRQEMRTCKPAVTKPPKAPSAACCNSLRNADLKCFCGYKNSRWLFIFGVDNNLAASLPARCGINWGSC